MDEDFRKPYEYIEEKRGFLLLFIIMLLVIDTLQTLAFTVQIHEAYQNTIIRISFIGLCILSILFMVFTAVNCYKLNKKMIRIAKSYLIARVIYSVGCIILIYIYSISHRHLVGEGTEQYRTVGQMVFWELLIPIAYVGAFSIGWYLYFLKSKRCREFRTISETY